MSSNRAVREPLLYQPTPQKKHHIAQETREWSNHREETEKREDMRALTKTCDSQGRGKVSFPAQ